MQHNLVFVNIKTFLCYISFFVVDMKYFFAQHQHVFVETKLLSVNVKLFISTQNYFSCNSKFLFWASFIMSCHGDIFLLSHSNKNIIACQKVNKLSFLCDTKNWFRCFCIIILLYSVFTLRIVSMLIFFVVVLETKKHLNIFYSHVWYISKQLLSKSFYRKIVS